MQMRQTALLAGAVAERRNAGMVEDGNGMKPFIDIVERQPIELAGRWKEDGTPAPCRSVNLSEASPAPKEEKRELPGSQYAWGKRDR
jgi:hypothetical protein